MSLNYEKHIWHLQWFDNTNVSYSYLQDIDTCWKTPPTDVLCNTLRLRQNCRHFSDNILKCLFLNENGWIPLQISLKFVPKVRINSVPALVQIMAWCRQGGKPLTKPMISCHLMHIWVTWPQWVKRLQLPNIDHILKYVWCTYCSIASAKPVCWLCDWLYVNRAPPCFTSLVIFLYEYQTYDRMRYIWK